MVFVRKRNVTVMMAILGHIALHMTGATQSHMTSLQLSLMLDIMDPCISPLSSLSEPLLSLQCYFHLSSEESE